MEGGGVAILWLLVIAMVIAWIETRIRLDRIRKKNEGK